MHRIIYSPKQQTVDVDCDCFISPEVNVCRNSSVLFAKIEVKTDVKHYVDTNKKMTPKQQHNRSWNTHPPIIIKMDGHWPRSANSHYTMTNRCLISSQGNYNGYLALVENRGPNKLTQRGPFLARLEGSVCTSLIEVL